MSQYVTPQPDVVAFQDGSGLDVVTGFLHVSSRLTCDALVLTHGAGSTCQSPVLAALAAAMAAHGLTVLRCDLPFRQVRPTGPPRPTDAAADRRGLERAVGALRRLVKGRIFLGGHSYGGRQASLLAAEKPDVAEALLLLAYPLRPPRGPERTRHFPALRIPALFVHGTRDPFGSPEDMTTALALISAPARLLCIEGARHDLTALRGGDPLAQTVEAFLSLVS